MVKIVNSNREEFGRYIKEQGKHLYFWGAGVMLQICFEQLLQEYNIAGNIFCITDTVFGGSNKEVVLANRKIKVDSVKSFMKNLYDDKKAVIVITCSFFGEILKFLDLAIEDNEVECFIAPLIYLENSTQEIINLKFRNEKLIPPIIHYCWFGEKELPEKSKNCIESWKKYCPNYEIKRWDESNIDLESNRWIREAYRNKEWAFVSDYVRLKVLYEHGGIYLDTDVEMIQSFDDLRSLKAFGGFERWPVLNTGGGCGSIPGFWLWKEIMELKDKAMDKVENILVPKASGYYDTLPLLNRGLKTDGNLQNIDDFTILPSEFFHPRDYVSCTEQRTVNTHSIHYFNWSWADEVMNNGKIAGETYYKRILNRSVKIYNN